jgi:hypothetical protein
MKKQNLNEGLGVTGFYTLLFAGAAVKLIAGGVIIGIARKLAIAAKTKGMNVKNFFSKEFWKRMFGKSKEDRAYRREAGITEQEEAILAQGAARHELAQLMIKNTFDLVKTGKLTAEQAVERLRGTIIHTEKGSGEYLAIFKKLSPLKNTATTATAASWKKVAGSILPNDLKFETAVKSVYGIFVDKATMKQLYDRYETAISSGKLSLLKTPSFPKDPEDYANLVGYKEQWLKRNVGKSNSQYLEDLGKNYRFNKLIWTLYH